MIKFDKMHGNGNDFVVMDSIRDDFVPKKIFIRKLADRNMGVGFDQLILIDLPTKPDLDFFVKFYNAEQYYLENFSKSQKDFLGLTVKATILA